MEKELTKEDLQEIIEIAKNKHGYDFSDYAVTSFERRVKYFLKHHNLPLHEIKDRLATDKKFFEAFIRTVTVNVTEMFRDPVFYRALREEVLPKLASYPIIKIWHAGCATGEEVFSVAILLKEAGLLSRSRIYATDINSANLEKAATGIIKLQNMKEYTANYIQSGGKAEFSNYYTAKYDHAIIDKDIRKHILFSQHNLVTDQAFNEFHLICCRNVLIYFNKQLQNRVIQLFYNSLSSFGYLALGSKESLLFTECRRDFDIINQQAKIFRKRN